MFYSPPRSNFPGLLQWDYSSAIKTPRAPPPIASSVAAAHRTPQDGRPSGTRRVCLSVFVPLTAHCHPARQCLKKAHFSGRFCGVRNASLIIIFLGGCPQPPEVAHNLKSRHAKILVASNPERITIRLPPRHSSMCT